MIQIVNYKASWADEFAEIGATLRHHLGDLALRIDHIGSTAVPNLPAKDLIDIQVTVAALSPQVAQAFYDAGYTKSRHELDHTPPGFPQEPAQWQKWLFKSGDEQRPVNAHVRLPGRLNQRFALLIRDYLRQFSLAARAYGEVKQAIIKYHPEEDMEVYYAVKNPVFDIIYCGAEYWAEQIAWEPDPSDR